MTPDESSIVKSKLSPRAPRPPRPHASTPRSNASSIRSGGIGSLAEEKVAIDAERQKKLAEQANSPW